jgi:hypothetical protein
MQELTFEQVEEVSGGWVVRGIIEAAGAASLVVDVFNGAQDLGNYFYENVMLSDAWLDDINFMQP